MKTTRIILVLASALALHVAQAQQAGTKRTDCSGAPGWRKQSKAAGLTLALNKI